jgi:hypothetical protein
MPSIDAIARQRADFVRTTSANVGAIAAASAGLVVAEELGDAIWHQTLLSFLALPVVTGNATGASFGSKQVYTFPEGWLYILKVVAYFNRITFNTAAGVDGDIGGGGSGDYSMGTTATADATLGGTDVDLLPSTAMLDPFVAGVGSSNVGSALATAVAFDGTSAAKSLYLNAIIDDADVADAAASDSVYFTGYARVTWMWLGDY